MKIGFATANLGIHGVATFTLHLSQWLQANGHAVTVITTSRGEWWSRGVELGLATICLAPKRWESVVNHVQRLARWITVQAFDLLVVNVGSLHSRPLQLALHLLPASLPVLVILHNDDPTVYEVAALNCAAWHYAVGVSPKVQQMAARRFGQKPIHLIPNGIPLPTAAELEQRLDWATPLRLLFVGRLADRQKGIFRLPAIMAECNKQQIAVHLTVIGDGPDRAELTQIFHALEVNGLVELQGSQPHTAVLAAMRTHHLLLLPSNYEGLPIVLLEAQAQGCVPLVARLPGITEHAIREGVSGISVAGNDVGGFVAAIATMLDPLRWRAFSAAGIQLTRQHFALSLMGEKYLQLFAALRQKQGSLPQRPTDRPSPFGVSDYLPTPLRGVPAYVRKQLPVAGVIRRLKGQARGMHQLFRYGVWRKLQAHWLGLRLYVCYRTLSRLQDEPHRKTILVIDYRLLRPEDSTFGRSNDLYIRLLQAQGWRVLLMPYAAEWDEHSNSPHGLKWDEPYAVQLRQQGFVVLSGWLLRWRRANWLRCNAKLIDAVLFRHPDAASAYMPLFRTHSAAKLIYLAPDLRAIRCQREYLATGKVAAWREAQMVAQQEETIFQTADAILTRSAEEQAWLTARYGDKVFQMPLFFYPTLPVAQPVLPTGQTLLFVGNFAHRPNPDGLHWFVQSCLPLLAQQCPAVKLIVVGSFAQADIFALQSEQITVLGRVSDAQLTALYQQARVVIAPLRFGAGVKGKVIEALAHGVPVVTTTYGVEGVSGLAQLSPPTNTPQAMADAIGLLLRDDGAWQQVAAAGQTFVNEKFSVQAAQATLTQLFTRLETNNHTLHCERSRVLSEWGEK